MPYAATITASGCVTPFTFAISAGFLPAGLSLNATTGVIGGTPTTAALSSFTIEITDATSQRQSAALSIRVNAPPLLLVTTTLPGGSLGAPYTATLTASGGTPLYPCSIIAGSLPSALVLNVSTGPILGTPTA